MLDRDERFTRFSSSFYSTNALRARLFPLPLGRASRMPQEMVKFLTHGGECVNRAPRRGCKPNRKSRGKMLHCSIARRRYCRYICLPSDSLSLTLLSPTTCCMPAQLFPQPPAALLVSVCTGIRGAQKPVAPPKNFRRLGRSPGSGGGREKGVSSSERYRYITVYVNKDASRISRISVAHRLHSCLSIYIHRGSEHILHGRTGLMGALTRFLGGPGVVSPPATNSAGSVHV